MSRRLSRIVTWHALVLVACRGAPTITRSGLDSLNTDLDGAFRACNATAAARLFSPDATISLVGLADVHGRDAFAAVLRPLFAQQVVREHRFTIVEFEVYDSVAYERGTFTWAAAPPGQAAKIDHGRYSLVRRRTPTG